MTNNWQKFRLDDVCIQITDGVHNTVIDTPHTQYYLLSCKNLKNGTIVIGENERTINEATLSTLRKRTQTAKGDVLLSSVGTIGETAIIKDENPNYEFQRSVAIFKPNPDYITSKFLFYTLNNNKKILQHAAHGAVQQCLFINPLKDFPISLPPLDVQRRIAGVLGALDDKIELNNKINQNLESQAQTLFNEQILKNTTLGKIRDYCSLKSGFAFKSSWWKDSGIKVIKIKNIEVSGLNLKDCSFVSDDKITLAKDFIVKGGDLLIAMTGATIGKFTIVPYVDEILLVNQRVGKFFLGDNPLKRLPFIYCTLKQPEIVSEIINRGQGSAQPNISGNDIMSISCIYPNNSVIEEFNNICKPYFEKIITNQYENMKLSAIRDALLPKLMSGEIDVENLPQSAIIPKE